MRALADTSVFVAREQGRPFAQPLPGELAICVVTLAELALGVVTAADAGTRARRLATLGLVEATYQPLPVDRDAAHAWSRLVGELRQAGRRAPVNDTWIAAVALSRGLPLVTQDDDYATMPGLQVIHV